MATHNHAEPSHKNLDNFVRNGKPVGELKGFSAPLVAKEAIHWLEAICVSDKPFALSIWVHEPHQPIPTRCISTMTEHFAVTFKGDNCRHA